MRLTMKSIIRWEQLNKKPFAQIDYGKEDDIISLFYVCQQSDDLQTTFDEFKKGLTEESVQEMFAAFEKRISLTAQFQSGSKKKEADDAGDDVYIKDVVPILVMNGLDVHFALNEMELCDLPIFLQAHDKNTKERLTAQRLWAFIQVSPHLKKGSTPKDLYPFGWEVEEQKEKSAEETAKGMSMFEAFMNSGKPTT